MKTLALCGLLAISASLANAELFGFGCITGNNATNCTTGETQLFVNVTSAGVGQVNFTFTNLGPLASSITDVYFDDGTLLGIASVTNGTGVDFSQGASPGDLPGGGSNFDATAGFTADSNPPTQPNGVNPNEWLTITFNLINGKTFQDTINALTGGTDLKIGIHVQGFANGGSESFVNDPPVIVPPNEVVPEPSSVLLFGTVAIGMVQLLRRKRTA